MLRLLNVLKVIAILYILSKIVRFFFRAGVASQQNRNFQQKSQGNINVDRPTKKPKRRNIKGGDYVDYEEVK